MLKWFKPRELNSDKALALEIQQAVERVVSLSKEANRRGMRVWLKDNKSLFCRGHYLRLDTIYKSNYETLL